MAKIAEIAKVRGWYFNNSPKFFWMVMTTLEGVCEEIYNERKEAN